MSLALAALLTVIVVAAIAATAVVLRARSADVLLRQRLHAELVLTLHDGTAWQGLLWAVDARTLILRRAVQLPAETAANSNATAATPTPVDGELLLGRDEIAYAQRPALPERRRTPLASLTRRAA